MLLLQREIDHATPLPWAELAHSHLEDSVLVVWEGAGHIATNHSPCRYDYLLDYLLNGNLPEDGARCTD